ncbi:MAG: hypothetical protein GVY18_16465 [Bacteroidetes bacterium]|nr:hypothetical protein [Bacteroidota bacterium]
MVHDQDTLARVGGTAITVARFEASYVDALIRTGGNDTEAARRTHLETMIDTHLLAAEARGRGLADDEVSRAAYALEQDKAVGARFYETALLDALPPLTEAELRTIYAKSKQQVVLRHLLYPTEADARDAYQRLQAGADFVDLANACFDLAEYDSLAGYLGPVGYFQVDDAVAEAAFALDKGEVSGPVRSRYGWHILRAEEWILDPLLTRDEFVRKQDGLASKYRQRRRRLEGDRFVRAFMAERDVQVNADGLRMLSDAIARLSESADEPEPQPGALSGRELPPLDPDALRQQLTPETALLAYTWQGERRTFTAADYVRWLPELPPGEVRQRPAASVGRALRNEVFAREGRARGLAGDAVVQREVAYQMRGFLADRLRDSLRTHSTTPPDEAMIQALAERYGAGQRERLVADYWYVPFDTYEAAQAAQERLRTNPAVATEYDGYHAFTRTDVQQQPGWATSVAKAPLGEPIVLGRPDGSWAVLYVTRRSSEVLSVDEMRPYLEQVLRRFTAEVDLLKQLRAQTVIERNEALFEALMEHVDPAM